MRLLIVIFGVFVVDVSIIMSQPNGYAEYNLPRDCELNERRPNLVDPNSFYLCLMDGSVLMKCVTGSFFNVTAGRCTEEIKDSSSDVELTSAIAEDGKEKKRCSQQKLTPRGIICPAIDPVDHSIYYPDPDACECFYQCDNRVAKRMPCREGLHFNVTANRCDWPEEAGCQSSVTFAKEIHDTTTNEI